MMRQETAAAANLPARPSDRPMHSIQLMQALATCLPREAIKVVDGGYSAAFAIQYLDATGPGGVTWVGSTGHIGVGLGFAIGARLAHPDSPVVAIMGDGAFGLCGLEFRRVLFRSWGGRADALKGLRQPQFPGASWQCSRVPWRATPLPLPTPRDRKSVV